MRKNIFTLMLGAAICGASPVFAMEAENAEFDIRAITPIKSGMDSDQRREAIQSFLKDALKPEYEFKTAEIAREQSRQAGKKTFQTYTLNNDSEWVKGEREKNGGLNRFLGYSYLKKAIEYFGLKTLCVVETRFAYSEPNGDISISIYPSGTDRLKNLPVIDSNNFCSYSRYVGDECLTADDVENNPEIKQELSILNRRIGFTDTAAYKFYGMPHENLRRKDGKIYIIDTEYGSFSNHFPPYFDGSGDLTFTFPR